MNDTPAHIISWAGPFGWPRRPGECPALEDAAESKESGVYLWTVPFEGKHLIYAAGFTMRPFVERIKEHTYAYRSGFFTILDVDGLVRGERVERWHGMFTKSRTSERLETFRAHREEFVAAAEAQLRHFRIFVGPLPRDKRLMARVESRVMALLYEAKPPFSEIPDRGMSLAKRGGDETPISVINLNSERFHVLPPRMEV